MADFFPKRFVSKAHTRGDTGNVGVQHTGCFSLQTWKLEKSSVCALLYREKNSWPDWIFIQFESVIPSRTVADRLPDIFSVITLNNLSSPGTTLW